MLYFHNAWFIINWQNADITIQIHKCLYLARWPDKIMTRIKKITKNRKEKYESRVKSESLNRSALYTWSDLVHFIPRGRSMFWPIALTLCSSIEPIANFNHRTLCCAYGALWVLVHSIPRGGSMFWPMTLAFCCGVETIANFNQRPLYCAYRALWVLAHFIPRGGRLIWRMILAMCSCVETIANFNHRPLYWTYGVLWVYRTLIV